MEGNPRERRPWLLLIVLLAVALRAVCWSRAALMMNDGPDFLWQAQRLLAGDPAAALAHPFHPLYAALTAGVGLLVSDLALAAVAVSIASGVLLVLAVHGTTRRVLPDAPRAALCAALVAAISPRFVGYAADVQSDGVCVALFAAGLWALVASHARGGCARRAALAGLCAGLAYLTRPEGLFLAVPALLLLGAVRARGESLGPHVRALVAFGLVALVVSAPYVAHVSSLSGRLALSLKPSLENAGLNEQGDYHLAPLDSPSGWPYVPRRSDAAPGRQHDGASSLFDVGLFDAHEAPAVPARELEQGALFTWPESWPAPWSASAPPVPSGATASTVATTPTVPSGPAAVLAAQRRGVGQVVATLLVDFVHAARVELLLLVIPGAVALWRRRREMALVLLGTTLAWLAVGAWQIRSSGYMTNRHFLLGLAPLLPVAGLGLRALASGRAWSRVLVALIVAESLRAGTADQRTDKLPRLEALAWVAERTGPEQWFFTHRQRDSWYAGRRAVATIMPVKQSSMVKRLRQVDAPYLVYDLEDLERHQAVWLENGWVVEVARFGEGDETVLVLEPAFPDG